MVDLGGGTALDDAAGVHHIDAIGVARDDAEIVRDDDQRNVEPMRSAVSSAQGSGPGSSRRARGRRLVGDDEFGLAGQRDRDHTRCRVPPEAEVEDAGAATGRRCRLVRHAPRLRFCVVRHRPRDASTSFGDRRTV